MRNNTDRLVINMKSAAASVPGQGVGSAYAELMSLLSKYGSEQFVIRENDSIRDGITHFHTINPSYFLSIPFAKRHGVTVGSVHFLPETVDSSLRLPPGIRKLFYHYLIRFYRSMDYLVLVTPYFIPALVRYGVPRDRIVYIPNCVDEDGFHPLPPDVIASVYPEYGLSPDRFTVLSVGQLQTRKGVFDFLDCARRMPETQFVWAGGFPFGRMASGYDDIKKALKSAPDNTFFPGIVPREKMNELYNLCDVMFLPSYEELFPMTVLEAMCVHKPVLLRDVPLYEEILSGCYCKAGDVDGFVLALRHLRDDPEHYQLAAQQSAAGSRIYCKERVARLWSAFYHSLTAERLPDRLKNPHGFAGKAEFHL